MQKMLSIFFLLSGLILLFIGKNSHIFLVYGAGTLFLGGGLCSFLIFGPKRIKGLETALEINFNLMSIVRVLIVFWAVYFLYLATLFMMDFPLYLKNQYSVLEGVPTEISIEEGGSYKGGHSQISVTINDKTLEITPQPKAEIVSLLGSTNVRIKYWPHSKWIICYDLDLQF